MSVYIKGMEMPTNIEPGLSIEFACGIGGKMYARLYHYCYGGMTEWLEVVPVPPHGDLIDRDALMKDGWLNLHKEVMRMGGYAIHELPLKNPSIPVIIPADENSPVYESIKRGLEQAINGETREEEAE